jgi:ribosomal protein RSM22 (predicted rRNA methylase)
MNDLPKELLSIIETELTRFPANSLKHAREELTARYKEGDSSTPFISSEIHRTVYAVVRLPATFAVCSQVFDEINKRMPFISFSSILDLGAGPGTATFAASLLFPTLTSATLIEQDSAMISLSKRLALPFSKTNCKWSQRNLLECADLPEHDLVVLSYSFGELLEEKQKTLLNICWNAAKKTLVIIEPGTPTGYSNILRARSQLISLGAHLIAPCPHAAACPMEGKGWCHFSKRLQRTKFHKLIKEGDLGYEDEKYSYIVASKQPCEKYNSRIVGTPEKHGGHSRFFICTEQGLQHKILSKRDGDAYKAARKLEWGDVLN